WCLLCIFSIMYCCVFFFFSSRRRHTRSKRDWSSDVCSSDLQIRTHYRELVVEGPRIVRPDLRSEPVLERGDDPAAARVVLGVRRSEERRVGKECRSRWAPER